MKDPKKEKGQESHRMKKRKHAFIKHLGLAKNFTIINPHFTDVETEAESVEVTQ